MRKKSQKGRPGPVGPECQKSAEKVEKVTKKNPALPVTGRYNRILIKIWKHTLSGPMRDTPPYRAIPFRDSIAGGGGIAPFCLVFLWSRASISEIPLLWGAIAPPLRMLSSGEALIKKEGEGYRTQLAMLRHPQNPHSAQ